VSNRLAQVLSHLSFTVYNQIHKKPIYIKFIQMSYGDMWGYVVGILVGLFII